MVGQTISHYKILEKLGEVPKSPASAVSSVNGQRAVVILRIPQFLAGVAMRGPYDWYYYQPLQDLRKIG